MRKIVLATAIGASCIGSTAFAAEPFALSSPDIKAGGRVSDKHYWNTFGCTGGNEMPALEWKGAPAGTRSFAITVYDKDAPTGSGFWHWVVYNIPAQTSRLDGGVAGGKLPEGATEGNTDLGKPGFLGPCPPVGRKHHYVYTLHALKVEKLEVPAGASAALTGLFLGQTTLEKATLSMVAGPRK